MRLSKLAPVLLIFSLVLAFAVGVLWQKVTKLEKKDQDKVAGTESENPTPKLNLSQVKELFNKNVIKFGNANGKLLIVEVSDPSCPYCQIAGGQNPELSKSAGSRFTYISDGGAYLPPVPEIKKLVDEGKASFVYLFTPGHGNGELATKALYCAYEKDKFWPVLDLLTTNKGYQLLNDTVQNDIKKSGVLADFLKKAIGPAELTTCLESGKYDQRLAEDTSLAGSLGVSGTPAFIVNDKLFSGAYSFKDMQSVVDSALK